jgi:hypothetical protein
VALVVAAAAAWFDRPKTPSLDAERCFKVGLATLLRGRIDAAGGDADAWEREVARFVLYHPAGRFPERKVTNPAAEPPGVWLEGEQGLHARLASTNDPGARWSLLYDIDEDARAARLIDPHQLGPDYSPEGAAGPGSGWDQLASWANSPDFGRLLVDQLGALWVIVADAPGPFPALAESLVEAASGARAAWLVPPGEPVFARWSKDALDAAARVVWVAEGERALELLQALADHPGVRDQTLAVVAIGAPLLGRSDREEGPLSTAVREDWMGRWFGHEHLDTEIVRITPYFSAQWLDRAAWPPGVAGLTLQSARFPEPSRQLARVDTIRAVDLGVLPLDESLPRDLVARALVWAVCRWLAPVP